LVKLLLIGKDTGYGGLQTAFRQLVSFLQEEGHLVGVISITDDDDDKFGGLDHVALRMTIFRTNKTIADKSKKLIDGVNAARKARNFDAEILVAIGLSNSANLIARYQRDRTFKLCLDVIADRSDGDPHLKRAARRFDAIAVQSPSMMGMLRHQRFEGCVLGWLPCFSRPPIAGYRRQPSARGDIRLAYFGRLTVNKGIDVFIGAFAEAHLHVPVTFDIYGDGPERDKLETLARSVRCEAKIDFKGFYPDGEHGAALMCDYDALVVPSQYSEGLPLVLLEAMSYGIPILTTKVGAIPDCCEDNPDFVLVDPDHASLSRGIERLVDGLRSGAFNPERLQEHYRERFSREAMGARWRQFVSAPRSFFQ
jgi:glycosyltransferase involved in cell wall biosynthesis